MKMTNEEYQEFIKGKAPGSPVVKDMLKAFLVGGLICCVGQGLHDAYTLLAGLDEETAQRLSANFGGGMKRGGLCGTIPAGLIVFGLFGVDDPSTLQQFYRDFEQRHNGLWDCRDLLKANATTGRPKREHCDKMIYETVEFIEGVLREKGLLPPA